LLQPELFYTELSLDQKNEIKIFFLPLRAKKQRYGKRTSRTI